MEYALMSTHISAVRKDVEVYVTSLTTHPLNHEWKEGPRGIVSGGDRQLVGQPERRTPRSHSE